MPFDIKPIVDTSVGAGAYNFDPGGAWTWLAKQDYSPSRAYESIGNYTRGHILGGPTFQQWLSEDDPRKYTVLAEPPPLTQAVLQGDTNGAGGKKIGQLNLDLVDPFGTMGMATGSFLGRDQPIIGEPGKVPAVFDPGKFLAEKGIDPFGTGDVGVPARLGDYALALPLAVLNKMRGISTPDAPASSGLQYRFQEDPGYWQLLDAARTDDQLRAVAGAVAARYIDPSRNQYLVQQLFDQFKKDRDQIWTAMSSGNDRVDYMAKWRLTTDLISKAYPGAGSSASSPQLGMYSGESTISRVAGFAGDITASIPFVGTQIATGLAPIDHRIEEAWKRLTPDERRNYLGNAGLATAALDFAVQLPLLSGVGGALAWAKGQAGFASTLYKAYDTTLRGAALVMGTGLTVAATNWALEAAWPEWSNILGAEIDRTRLISKSSLAGVVNELGFWASGSFGVVPAVQVATRVSSKVLGVAGDGLAKLHVPHPTIGDRELTFFRDGYGGSRERTELVAAGLHPAGLDTSIKASFLSHLINFFERDRVERIAAALRGETTPWADINAMDPEARGAWGQDVLSRGMQDGPIQAEGAIRILGYARRPKPINPSENARAAYERVQALAKTLDEQTAATVVHEYGPDFIASRRMVGVYEPKAMEEWAKAKVTELGGDGTKLGGHDAAGWERIIRTLHQYEYHRINGDLHAAVEAEQSAEAGKIAVIASDHIFRDDAAAALKVFEEGDATAAKSIIAELIRTRREAAAWFTREWKPRKGVAKTPENVPPSVFQAWLEDALPALPTRRVNAQPAAETRAMPINALQQALDRQGTWTLAFKPVDEAGNFVSYTRTRGGGILRSPWVEYPLTASDNLELGNRGYLASKIDSMTRGFRTRALTEFQRAFLFRRLTTRVDVLPEQIDAFHEGILRLARDSSVPPQAVGAITRLPHLPLVELAREKLDALAESVFGAELRDRNGKVVKMDWPAEISKAYRQSFRLNMSAGVTSYLKSLGPVGGAVSLTADVIYPLMRFGLSPLFRGGELVEGDVFNGLRGVFGRDGTTEGLFAWGGLGNDGTLLNAEMSFDGMTQSLGQPSYTTGQRLAASLSLHARHLPEDLPLQREIASTQAAAENRPFRAAFSPAEGLDPQRLMDAWGWDRPTAEAKVGAAEMVPTELLMPLREVDRRADPRDKADAVYLDDLAADIQGNGIKSPLEIWWDPVTNHAAVVDGNHRLTLANEQGWEQLPAYVVAHTTDEVGWAKQHGVLANPKADVQIPPNGILRPSQIFGEADAPLDLPDLATDKEGLLRQLRATFATEPSLEGGLRSELDGIVGENGVTPGLEVRAKEILDQLDAIERAKGDDGPVMAFADQSPARQRDLRQMMFDAGDIGAVPTHAELETAYARWQRRPGNASTLDDVAGTPEALFDNMLPAVAAVEAKKPGPHQRAWQTFVNPVRYKQGRALALQVDLMEKTFPGLLRASGNDGVVKVFEQLGIREDHWARWLLEDRRLLDDWIGGKGDPAALDALLAHAGDNLAERRAFDELYASDEWATLTGLWSLNLGATRDEAFGVHFFSPYRSAIERSINHPVLGIYPASWTIKAAREWAKFLFDNRTFGELRLGMAPAQAIAEISRAQASQFAQTHDETWSHFLEKGPLGSTIFIFNLLMPGDWSSLPFPASRTIRELLRGDTDPAKILTANLDFMGVTRDVRLIGESLGEIRNLVFPVTKPDKVNPLTGWSVRGEVSPYLTDRDSSRR